MANAKRDRLNAESLRAAGWSVLIVWECEINDKTNWLEPIEKALAGNH